MVYRVQLTDRAEQDLTNILDYLTNHLGNLQAARRLMNSFEEGIQQLSLFLELGEVVRNRYFSVLSVRKKRIKNYNLYYVLDRQDEFITIIRIGHHLQDRDNLLLGLE